MRYKFSVEFDSEHNPSKWFWPDLVDIDDEFTVTDWSTWNVQEVE